MSNMSRGRKAPLESIKAARKAGFKIPTTKEVPAGQMTKEIGRRASKQVAKQAAAKAAAKKTRRQRVANVASKAGADMAEGLAADRARFSQEHDQAVERGAASHARMRQATPGKAAAIIKKRRI